MYFSVPDKFVYFSPSNDFSKNPLTISMAHCVKDLNMLFIQKAIKLRSEVLDLKRDDLTHVMNLGIKQRFTLARFE